MNSARTQAIQIAKEKILQHPLYLDTETTGTERTSEIIEIGIVDDEGGVLFKSLVKPAGKIPFDVVRIHGITNEMVIDSPRWREVWPDVERLLAGKQVGIYNAEFDLRLIEQSAVKYRIPSSLHPDTRIFCIMKLYAQFYGEWNSTYRSYRYQSLESACKQCRIPLYNNHRSIEDALLARAVLHYIAKS